MNAQDTDQTWRPTQTPFHLSVGYIHLSEDAFWYEKCWSYFSVGHVFFFPWPQTHIRGLYWWFSVTILQESWPSSTPSTYPWTMSLLSNPLESKQVQFLCHIRLSIRFHHFDNMDHGRSSKGWGNSSVASLVHNPSASKFTGKSELFTAFHRELCWDHKGFYAFIEEGCSFSLGPSCSMLFHSVETCPHIYPSASSTQL